MSTFKFVGNPKLGGLPRGSRVRIEALPQRMVAFEGEDINDAVYVDLDPGKYAFSVVRKSSPAKIDDAIYKDEFFHEMSEESWKAIQRFEPRLFKVIHTSKGVRWRCQHPLCEDEFSTTTAALLHEMEHFGISREEFLADPTGAGSKAAGRRAADFAAQIAAAAGKAGRLPQSGIPG